MEIEKLVERYASVKEVKEKRLKQFFVDKTLPFLLMQSPPGNIWGTCNTIDEIYRNNILYFEKCINNPYTDVLPYLEPWIGVGVYANAFGCEYKWRNDNAPDTHYCCNKIEEVKKLDYPDWKKSVLMKMVMDCISVFKERTKDRLPIVITDTQSPFDTATLILDAAEFFTACYTDEDIVKEFMQKITDLVIEFSRAQIDLIGESSLVLPGHIFPAARWMNGIALSDDNVAVASPDINERIAMPFNQQIADAFGGLAIHSCGNWEHTMGIYSKIRGLSMIDCALSLECDPNPNQAKKVSNALKGSGVIAKVRIGKNRQNIKKIVEDLVTSDLRLIVQIEYEEGKAEENYQYVNSILEDCFAKV